MPITADVFQFYTKTHGHLVNVTIDEFKTATGGIGIKSSKSRKRNDEGIREIRYNVKCISGESRRFHYVTSPITKTEVGSFSCSVLDSVVEGARDRCIEIRIIRYFKMVQKSGPK